MKSLAVALLVVAAVATSAHAQKAALFDGTPHQTVDPTHHHPSVGLGGSAVLGWAEDGWVARVEYELWPVMAAHGTFGPVMGVLAGFEYWRDGDDQGFAMPVVVGGGVRVGVMRALLGIGIYALTIDSLDGDAGAGAWGPIAMASMGLDVWGVRLGIDARATRHLNLGAPDFNQLQLGISAGYTWSGTGMTRVRRRAERGARP